MVAVEVVVKEDMRVDEEVGDLMMTGGLLGEMTEEEGVTGEETVEVVTEMTIEEGSAVTGMVEAAAVAVTRTSTTLTSG